MKQLILPSIKHLINLTDQIGLIQHSKFSVPDLSHGYSIDDNARGVLAMSLFKKNNQIDEYDRLLGIYLNYVISAKTEDGLFRNFKDKYNKWIDTSHPHLGDAFGRVFWCISESMYLQNNSEISNEFSLILNSSFKNLKNVKFIRAKAFILIGLYYYIQSSGKKRTVAKNFLVKYADQICSQYFENQTDEWLWFENEITYENSRIPQSLFFSYLETKNKKYLDIAKRTLDFLINIQYENNMFQFIGQSDWYKREGLKSEYDEQPVEAGGMIEACILAYEILGEEKYLNFAKDAFLWYAGKNKRKKSMFDLKSMGVRDGIKAKSINLNQGAESILTFLIGYFKLLPHIG